MYASMDTLYEEVRFQKTLFVIIKDENVTTVGRSINRVINTEFIIIYI